VVISLRESKYRVSYTINFREEADSAILRTGATFLNHLFPDHGISSSVLHELEGAASPITYEMDAGVENLHLGQNTLQQQQCPLLENYVDSQQMDFSTNEQSQLRQIRISTVVQQWNDGFFAPRGLGITLQFTDPRVTPQHHFSPSGRRTSRNALKKTHPSTNADESLLHQAVARGKRSKVREALERGESLDVLNRRGETPLFKAVVKDERAIVEILLGKGANPALRPQGEYSPLQHAVSRDKKTILKMLVEKCTLEEIEEVTPAGETALYLAVQKQSTACVEVGHIHYPCP